MIDDTQLPPRAQTPSGLNHLVLRVRNIDESHAFWTECLGFVHVGTTYSNGNDVPPKETRYYSGRCDGKLSHHDIALAEDSRLQTGDPQLSIDHIAIEYASEEAWKQQAAFLTSRHIAVLGCLRRGTTMSARVIDPNGYTIELVCELPRELWQADINAALNKKPTPLAVGESRIEALDAR